MTGFALLLCSFERQHFTQILIIVLLYFENMRADELREFMTSPLHSFFSFNISIARFTRYLLYNIKHINIDIVQSDTDLDQDFIRPILHRDLKSKLLLLSGSAQLNMRAYMCKLFCHLVLSCSHV